MKNVLDTGERKPLGLRRHDEIGALVEMFDAMLMREDRLEAKLLRANTNLRSDSLHAPAE